MCVIVIYKYQLGNCWEKFEKQMLLMYGWHTGLPIDYTIYSINESDTLSLIKAIISFA